MVVIKSKISRDLAQFIIKKFIKPEHINEKSGTFFSRETGILGALYAKYPNEDFWRNMNLGFPLNSLAFFKTLKGANELEKQWKLYSFSKELDRKNNLPTFEVNRIPDLPIVSEKKLGTLSWIDS